MRLRSHCSRERDEEPPVSAEIEELRAYWRDHPRKWAALSETGRQTLSETMFGAPGAGNALFGGCSGA